MKKEEFLLYVNQDVILFLKTNFQYTCKILEVNLETDTIKIQDIKNEIFKIDCESIAVLKEVKK